MDANAFIIEPFDCEAGHVVNAMTVDVEDYFQVSAFEGKLPHSEWARIPYRVERNTTRVLELFDDHGVTGTFFTLGWVAERFPNLIRHIAEMGHEIASHGLQHTRVTQQVRGEFYRDAGRSRKMLEDISGKPVIGYRAASYSIGAENLWALDVLRETGYKYSSSIYPIRHDLYGMPEAPRFPFRLKMGGLIEIPVSTVELRGRKFPCGGGGYFRLFPYLVSKWALARVNHHDRYPVVFYFHPWEIDPGQPRIKGLGLKTKFRHYLNLNRMEARLERLLQDFRWDRMDRVFQVA